MPVARSVANESTCVPHSTSVHTASTSSQGLQSLPLFRSAGFISISVFVATCLEVCAVRLVNTSIFVSAQYTFFLWSKFRLKYRRCDISNSFVVFHSRYQSNIFSVDRTVIYHCLFSWILHVQRLLSLRKHGFLSTELQRLFEVVWFCLRTMRMNVSRLLAQNYFKLSVICYKLITVQ